MPGDGDGGAAGTHGEEIGAGSLEVSVAQKAIDGEPGGNRVLGVADECAVALGNAARLVHQPRMRIDHVEEIAAGMEQVDLMGGDERAHGQRVVPNELDGLR